MKSILAVALSKFFLVFALLVPGVYSQQVGLYGGDFHQNNVKRWYHQGKGFHNIQTYWGPSYPSVDQYVEFLGKITQNMRSHASGKMKLLIDVRRAFTSKGTGEKVQRAGWEGYQWYPMEDRGVDHKKLEELLRKIAKLPNADLVLGFYVADEDVGRYLDVQAVREMASSIKNLIKKNQWQLPSTIYANFASTSVLSGENPVKKGFLRYFSNSQSQIVQRDKYNVDGKLSKKYGPRGYGIFGKSVDVVMVNWYEDRGDRPGKVWDGDLGIYGDTILDSQLQRVHNDLSHWEKKLEHKYQFDIVIGYGKSAWDVDRLIQNIQKPVNKNYRFRKASAIWFWAWYPYKPFGMKGVGDQWADPKQSQLHNIEAIVRELHGDDINQEDTDGDGVTTGKERANGTNPFDYRK